MTTEPAPISTAARHALEKELTDLRGERDTIAATLTDTDATGDSADQADELQRATELDRIDARIRDLDRKLGQAVAATEPSTDLVGVGNTVTVRFSDDSVETLQIGDIAEEPRLTLVTADSPLGRALQGRSVGATVEYATPAGHASAVIESIGTPSRHH